MVDLSRALGLVLRLRSVLQDDVLRARFLDELQVRGFLGVRKLVHEQRHKMDRVLYVELCKVLDEKPLPEGSQ